MASAATLLPSVTLRAVFTEVRVGVPPDWLDFPIGVFPGRRIAASPQNRDNCRGAALRRCLGAHWLAVAYGIGVVVARIPPSPTYTSARKGQDPPRMRLARLRYIHQSPGYPPHARRNIPREGAVAECDPMSRPASGSTQRGSQIRPICCDQATNLESHRRAQSLSDRPTWVVKYCEPARKPARNGPRDSSVT